MRASTHYGGSSESATRDLDLAILSNALLGGMAVLAGRRRALLEARSYPSPDLDVFIAVEDRIRAELERRRGRAA